MKTQLLSAKSLLAAALLLTGTSVFAQLTVNNAVNAVDGVQNVLLGNGVTATNITYSGNNDQIASFDCTNCNLGIPSGLILSSGNAATAVGPNNLGGSSTSYGGGAYDADLDAISAVSINDACILQFDFIPTGDSLVFNFVFGSDEYPEYANSNFNDAFGFFISGPGINGTYTNQAMNIALIPGTTVPLTINNLNNGTTGTGGPCEYCAFYNHNGSGLQAPFNGSNFFIQPDGFSDVIQAYAPVICGETYHIKLAIADGGDTSFNSWVFLEAGSFSSNALSLQFNQPGISPSLNSLYEGCNGASVTFSRPIGSIGELVYDLSVSGTAVNGIDYVELPNQIILPDGINEVTLPINGMIDGNNEGQETIVLTVSSTSACASTASINLFIDELEPLTVVGQDVVLDCGENASLSLAISGGYGEYQIEWDNGSTGNSLAVDPVNGEYFYTVMDTCGVVAVNGSINVSVLEYGPISLEAGPDQTVDCLDYLLINPTVVGGNGTYTYDWVIDGTSFSSDIVLFWPNPQNANVVLNITDGCGETATDNFNVALVPVPINLSVGNDVITNCLDVVTVSPTVSGGVGFFDYQWTVNGTDAGTNPTVVVPAADGLIVEVTVTDDCGNSETDQMEITIAPDQLNVTLPDDFAIPCDEGMTISPTVSGNVGEVSYEWFINGVSQGNDISLFVPAQVGTVTVQVGDECGNTGSDAFQISILDEPIIINLPATQNVNCMSNFTINPTVSGGSGSLSYVWTEGGNVLGTNSTLPYSVDGPSTIQLTVTDACGNESTDAISIVLNPVNINLNVTSDQTICPGESVNLTVSASNGITPYTYAWSTGSTSTSISASPSQTTTFQVGVVDLCGNTASGDVQVTVLIPVQPLSIVDNPEVCLGVVTGELFAGGVLPLSVNYDSAVLDYDPNEGFTGLTVGTTTITITDFCDNTVSTLLSVSPCETVIPNIFTPNNDALNANFFIYGLDGFPGSTLLIYNRWGGLVYEDANYENDWNARDVAEGTYFYILKRSDGKDFSGNLTITR